MQWPVRQVPQRRQGRREDRQKRPVEPISVDWNGLVLPYADAFFVITFEWECAETYGDSFICTRIGRKSATKENPNFHGLVPITIPNSIVLKFYVVLNYF